MKQEDRGASVGPGCEPAASAADGVFAESHPSREWTLYAEQKPDREGVFEWRVPSRAVPGIMVQFFCHMRKRGAGYTDTIAPLFDHWDGYRVTVPPGTQWREAENAPELKWHSYGPVSVPDLRPAPCPYCGKVPTLKGMEKSGNGIIRAPDPHRLNSWWLDCCSWARTPHFNDPRELVENRNAMLASAMSAGTAETPQEAQGEARQRDPQGDAQPSEAPHA